MIVFLQAATRMVDEACSRVDNMIDDLDSASSSSSNTSSAATPRPTPVWMRLSDKSSFTGTHKTKVRDQDLKLINDGE